MEKELVSKLKYLINKKKDLNQICEELGMKDYEIIGIVELLKESGELIDYVDGQIVKLKKPKASGSVYQIPNKLETLKLLLISDTHLCSKYDRLDILRYLYDKAESEGVKHILHSGDFTDGKSNRAEHIYELKEHSYEGQVQYCIENYPSFNGKTYVIAGNHDGWWYKSNGSEILKPIANAREDIVYLGPDVADMKIGKLKIHMFHGKGGQAYAKSYKAQKYIETISVENRPHILQLGHIHQAFFYQQDNTMVFQTGCLEDQTPFCRSQGFNDNKSCWWVKVEFDNRGNVYCITPTLETFGNKLVRKRK